MLNEQEREYNGVKLVAKPQNGCEGCYFDYGGMHDECWNGICLQSKRKDKTPIIWVKKQEPKPWYPPVPKGFSEWVECGGKGPGLADGDVVARLFKSERINKRYSHDPMEIDGKFLYWGHVVAYCIKLNQPKESEPESTHPTIMAYDPVTGESNPYPSEASQYRAFHGDVAWLYNPYTGDKRDPRDIGSDVFGFLIKD